MRINHPLPDIQRSSWCAVYQTTTPLFPSTQRIWDKAKYTAQEAYKHNYL